MASFFSTNVLQYILKPLNGFPEGNVMWHNCSPAVLLTSFRG